MNYLYFLIPVVLCILSYHCYLSYFKHSFWYKQPVSRSLFKKKDGVIIKSSNLIVDDQIDKKYSWNTINNIEEFQHFLQNNYSRSEYYTTSYLNWILNFPYKHITKLSKMSNRNDLNISLYHKDQLIGTIIGRPIILKIDRNIVEGFYVDFLCVHRDYRNQQLAPKLISKLLFEWKKYKLDIHIFKIDNNPLPFDHIGCFNYYYYDLSKKSSIKMDNIVLKDVQIEKLNDKYLEKAYNYFYDYISKYKMYQVFTLEEFKYYHISNKNIETFITIDNDKITGFFTFTKMKYKHPFKENTIAKCVELTYFLSDNVDTIYNFIDHFKKYDFLIFLDVMQNRKLTNILDVDKGHKTYYQLYNFYSSIKNDDIGLLIH
jgi:hypothetical protein